MATKWCTKLEAAWKRCPIVFSCDQIALQMVFSVCPSVCVSVCPSVRPLSVTPFYPRPVLASGIVVACVCVCQCTRKTFMIHQTFVWWALYTLYIVSNLSHRTFGPSQWKCLMCPMIFMNTGVCVCQSLACPHDKLSPVQARITKFDPEKQNTLVKIPFVLGGNWPWPSRSNLTSNSKLTPFWACPSHY